MCDELLWDIGPDPGRLPDAVRRAAARHAERLGVAPTVVYCHPQALNGVREVDGVALRARAGIGSVQWIYLAAKERDNVEPE